MWSKAILCRFRQSWKVPQTQVLQGFAAFRLALFRIPPRHSQTTRATNCANPGFWVIEFIEFCARCGQTCGQVFFLTTSACGGSACIAGVSRDCGHGIFWLEGGATRSQTTHFRFFVHTAQEPTANFCRIDGPNCVARATIRC